MAAFIVNGFIDNIKYLPNGCVLVFVSEFKKGYKTKTGQVVEDKYMQWKCIFKQGLRKYINDHFNTKMFVEVKGEILPYAIENNQTVDGYSVIGQALNMMGIPRAMYKQEQKMIKESLLSSNAAPDLDSFNQPDF